MNLKTRSKRGYIADTRHIVHTVFIFMGYRLPADDAFVAIWVVDESEVVSPSPWNYHYDEGFTEFMYFSVPISFF